MSYQRNNQQNKNGPGPIPNRWLHCPRKSESIIAEHFLAFKTPLSAAFNDQMPLECLFHPQMIFGYCKTINLKLGLWIDLTNTKRFYDRKIVEDTGAQYVKLQCRGHGETPSREQTNSFIEIVNHFLNERPFDVIGVHCTHGFNRTGFLICSFLVERYDCDLPAALTMFAKARPPGIYKQDYIDELYRRYETTEDPIQAPELPAWCLEYDDSDRNGGQQQLAGQKRSLNEVDDDPDEFGFGNLDADENDAADDGGEDGNVMKPEGGGGHAKKKRRRVMFLKDAKFMDGVPDVQLVTDHSLLSELQELVQKMCGWEKNGFPGAQPVSMDRKNIIELHEHPYKVSWKADGTRYMMLIKDREEIYFIDRNFSLFLLENFTFLRKGKLDVHVTNTLIDGEMVLDRQDTKITPRFLVYDIVTLNNQDVSKLPFPERLHLIKHELYIPRQEGVRTGLIHREHESISVLPKEFWDITMTERLLGEKFAKSLQHELDGLIFQPTLQPYTAGPCASVFKWKPHELNSVDFRLKVVVESGMGIVSRKIGELYVGGQDHVFSRIKYTSALKSLDNKIIECTVTNQGEWQFLRERTDKTMPNSYNTAVSVLESIRNPVTKEYLLAFIQKYGYRNDHDKMPPPSSSQVQRSHPQQQHHQQQQQQHRHHQQQQQQQHHLQQQQQQQHHLQQQQQLHNQHQQSPQQQHVQQQQELHSNQHNMHIKQNQLQPHEQYAQHH